MYLRWRTTVYHNFSSLLLKPFFFAPVISWTSFPTSHTGLLTIPYKLQPCSLLMFVLLAPLPQASIYMTASFTSFRSLLKGNYQWTLFWTLKKILPHIPSLIPPALVFLFLFPFFIFLYITYQSLTYYALAYFLIVCHTQLEYKLFEIKDSVLFTAISLE